MDFPRFPRETKPEYIGDGVYVTFDGYTLWLRTFRDGRWESIALESEVYGELTEYVKRLRKKKKAKSHDEG